MDTNGCRPSLQSSSMKTMVMARESGNQQYVALEMRWFNSILVVVGGHMVDMVGVVHSRVLCSHPCGVAASDQNCPLSRSPPLCHQKNANLDLAAKLGPTDLFGARGIHGNSPNFQRKRRDSFFECTPPLLHNEHHQRKGRPPPK